MNTTNECGRSTQWQEMYGLFDWAEVIGLVERAREDAVIEVRASLARVDRSGVALYHVFVTQDRH